MKRILFVLYTLVSFASKSQTLNAYAKVTSVTGSSVLALSNVNIANHTFTVGGQVVVMQMQDNVIGANTTNVATFGNLSAIANAGRYEIRTIAAVTPTSGTPTSVTLTASLANTFNTGANSSVQLISFRDMGTNFTTTANIGCLTWNGNVGGVIAFYVTNTLTLNHRILADGDGFSGGRYSNDNGGPVCATGNNTVYITNSANWGFKGEGIYKNTNTNFANARGRILNGGGGGNDHNAGGGGGGNYTAGGQGGNGYNNCTAFPGGGLGGLSLSGQISASCVFMGGGGGGGQQNNSQNSSGGNGGGIVLIKANTIQTSTTCGASIRISANGNNASNGGNDGMGGGGAGGSIVIDATTFSINASCPLLVRANGGDGGDCTDGAAHAGGGGGGQGAIIYSSAQPTSNVTTQTNNGAAGQDNSGGAISAGNGSGSNGSGVIASSSGPLPITLLDFKGEALENQVRLEWHTASETNNDYFTLEKSTDGINYGLLSKVKGAGTSKAQKNYSSPDYQPSEGINYYRLKQTDFDGKYKEFPIISVPFLGNTDFSFFPNPSKSGEYISFLLSGNSHLKTFNLSILNLTGNEIYSKTIFNDSENKVEFTLSDLNLATGVYFIKIHNGSSSQIKKLVVY
ncbi:T9SS type A sorting domain-containing protein [Aurantibacillus circumpalustris]|uniref:T9SS type A sorting domain-containing protein n=1 Tax=Aurantibacillus circumpalustris TaxID=3036359 RepID=UPI00295AAEE1|nr:T9SS type A sorting domain-containing protein [Aurantibacillus circumpalustris]